MKADLDGNGTPDRLLLWESQAPDDIGGQLGDQPPQVGAVAYLDDGTFHLLEESAASWQLPPPRLAWKSCIRRRSCRSATTGGRRSWLP